MQFRKSIGIANSFLIYLPFLALTGIWIVSEETGYSLLWLLIPSSILTVIVYGRIVEITKNSDKSSWKSLIAKHLFNYIGAELTLIIPVLGLYFVYSHLNNVTQTKISYVVGALISCLTVYVLPLVFMEQRVVTVIPQGILFLFHNLRKSILLILLSLLISVIKMLVGLSIPHFVYRTDKIQTIFGIGFLQNIIFGYIDLIVFAMAATFIIEERKKRNEQQILFYQ